MANFREAAPSAVLPDRSVGLQQTPWQQFRSLLKAFWTGDSRTPVLLLTIGIVVVICVTAYMQVRLNAWNRPFYDALQRKDGTEFVNQLLVFLVIVAILLVLNVGQNWLNQVIKLKLREWLTRDLITEWLQQRRAFRIAKLGEIGANPDQRIHQDGQQLTALSTDLGVGLFQSGLLLASFIGVLWVLSAGIVIEIQGNSYSIPGYMVWAALLYAAAGSWLSWLVGHPLVTLNASRYAREAELRSALVRTHEQADGIVFHGGENDKRQRLLDDLANVLQATRRIILASVRLNWITAGYGWLAIVVPIVVASPGYFGGQLSFGELMVVVGAFNQVQGALRWFIDNTGAIADWRATLLRVMTFRNTLLAIDELEERGERIEVGPNPDGYMRFENVSIVTPGGTAHLAEGNTEVKPGEHVLIVGKPGTGKTSLFLAIAGLPSLGTGRILLPPLTSMGFLSQRPYVPSGSLREALSSPRKETDQELLTALNRVGLGHLSASLDRVRRWDRELTTDEQHRLAVARLLLTKPQWVISDEALDVIEALDGHNSEEIFSIFRNELAGAAVVSFAPRPSPSRFYGRVLHLVGPAEPVAPQRGLSRIVEMVVAVGRERVRSVRPGWERP